MLTIPSFRYIKKLISAISVETGLTDQSIKYLETRIAKLNDREKIGSLIFDEIYVAKRCEFSRSTGQIFGMENNQPSKTLLAVMFKSVAAEYEDVIGMVPLTITSSSILHELFTKVLESITAIGYEVVVNLVDGHSSNVKFYAAINLLCLLFTFLIQRKCYFYFLIELMSLNVSTTISNSELHSRAQILGTCHCHQILITLSNYIILNFRNRLKWHTN